MTEEINVNLPGDYQIAGVNAFVSGYCPNCKEKKNSRFKMSIFAKYLQYYANRGSGNTGENIFGLENVLAEEIKN